VIKTLLHVVVTMHSVETWLIHFQIGSQLRGNQGYPIKLAVVKVGVLGQLNLAKWSPWKYSHQIQ